jgi:hypothetical protein
MFILFSGHLFTVLLMCTGLQMSYDCPKSSCILMDERRHPSIQDIRLLSGAHCGAGHYLVVAKVREGLTMSKQATRRFRVEF